MRVLLVEDDTMIAEALSQALKDAAYAVDWVSDGVTALASIDAQEYGVVLLDLGLPRKDGMEVLRQLRLSDAGKNQLPVLIVTARDAVDDRILGLDLGADDYLVKPFETKELLARMRAVIRRHGGQATAELSNGLAGCKGTLQLNPSTKIARFENNVQPLSAREYALLHALMLRPGAILSRAELEDRIYGWNEEVESNAVEFLIHALRKKLGAHAIKNVRGMGWLVPTVEQKP